MPNKPAPNPLIDGIQIGVASTQSRYLDRNDLVVFKLAEQASVAATFTTNRFAAAPILVAKQHLQQAACRYLIINAGNANAGTGAQGQQDALACCKQLAKLGSTSPETILPFSTGVIGEYLPLAKIQQGIEQAYNNLSARHWEQAAKAIMTTDTFPKHFSQSFTLNGQPCQLMGIAKGSGMIHPQMATMLAFIATDATVNNTILQTALNNAVEDSFNLITVDGDTSTNDACVAIATGQGPITITDETLSVATLTSKLTHVCKQLAQMIVQDGEGATKLARIQVTGGRDRQECKSIAHAVGLSPLVKTMLFAQDPNWGRVLAAIGRAPVADFDPNQVNIWFDDLCVVRQGVPDRWYTEDQGQAVLQKPQLTITVEMNQGEANIEVLTCDLSTAYVEINASYRS